MKKRFFSRLQQSVMGGAIIIGAASFLSRILGLVRDRLLTTTFGADSITDVYFAAFKIPDFIFNLLVLGALSASFVPLFVEQRETAGKKAALAMASQVLNIIVVVFSLFAFIAFLFAPQIIQIIAYADTPSQQAQIVLFSRIMLGATFFFTMGNVFSGILHAEKKFLIYALSPILYNIGIIVGIVFFYPLFGSLGLPIGVVVGGILQCIILIPSVRKIGFRFQWKFSLRDPAIRKILTLMPPRAFALGLSQINTIIIFAIASTFGSGSRSVWQYADNLQHFPINIFGVSLALAVFPVFSAAFAKNDLIQFRTIFSENVRRILFFIIPVSIIILLLRAQIVRLVYGAGAFNWEDTFLTAQVLGVFSLSLFAQALIPLFTRAFFAKQDTITPVTISTISVVLNVFFAFFFVHYNLFGGGIISLATAFSFSAIAQMFLLLAVLRIRHGDLDDDHIMIATWKMIIAAAGLGISVQSCKYVIAPLVDMQTFLGIFLQTTISATIGIAIYIFIADKWKFEEAMIVKQKIRSVYVAIQNLTKM